MVLVISILFTIGALIHHQMGQADRWPCMQISEVIQHVRRTRHAHEVDPSRYTNRPLAPSGSTAKGLQVGGYSSFEFGKGGADIDLVHEDLENQR